MGLPVSHASILTSINSFVFRSPVVLNTTTIWKDSWLLNPKNKLIPVALDIFQKISWLIPIYKIVALQILITMVWPAFNVWNPSTFSTLMKKNAFHATQIKFMLKISTFASQERKSRFLRILIDFLPLPKLLLLNTKHHL